MSEYSFLAEWKIVGRDKRWVEVLNDSTSQNTVTFKNTKIANKYKNWTNAGILLWKKKTTVTKIKLTTRNRIDKKHMRVCDLVQYLLLSSENWDKTKNCMKLLHIQHKNLQNKMKIMKQKQP